MHRFIIRTLVTASLKSVIRSKLHRRLFWWTTIVLLCTLGGVWLSSGRESTSYFSNEKHFKKLSFDMICEPKRNVPPSFDDCAPYYGEGDAGSTSPASLLLSVLQSSASDSEEPEPSSKVQTMKFANLLGSLMMNGFPLLGIDDYFQLSDFINKNIGHHARREFMESSTLKSNFGNLFNIRDRELRLTPDNCVTRGFAAYLLNASNIIDPRKVRVYNSMAHAMSAHHCCDNTWAVIEITNVENLCHTQKRVRRKIVPAVTFRMHPSTVPDTRNIKWSPRKQGAGGMLDRRQSGQLLYFTSGFLTLQMEIQNYLAMIGLGGSVIETSVFRDPRALPQPSLFTSLISKALMAANDQYDVSDSLRNISDNAEKPVIRTPLYLRAYPRRGYQLDNFWHKLPSLYTTVIVMYFSLPLAIVAGYFCREASGGHFDSLFTLPGVQIRHCAAAWAIACGLLTLFPFASIWALFHAIQSYSSAVIPAIALLLMGLAMGPVVIALCLIIKRSEATVLAIPTVIFLAMLPGMLYYDLAFDVQRSAITEMFISLFPPSAAALILRLVCTSESLHAPATWMTRTPIGKVTILEFTLLLVVDLILYSVLVYYYIENYYPKRLQVSRGMLQRVNTVLSIDSSRPRNVSSFNVYEGTESVPSGSSIRDSFGDTSRDGDLRCPAVVVTNVCKEYVSNGVGISVLEDVNTTLYEGNITCLLGSNGAGKTTFMRLLCGLDPHYTGTVSYISTHKVYEDDGVERRNVGWCGQQDALYDNLTVREHLEMYLDLLGDVMRASECITESLRQLGLDEHADKYSSALSGGMKRRLSLALACIGNPRVLLLDEPTNGCDSYTRELVRKDILSRRSDCAILISTHHIDDVEVISDRIWFLNDHHLVFDGAKALLQREYTVGGLVDPSSHIAGPSFYTFATANLSVKELFIQRFPIHEMWLESPREHIDQEAVLCCWRVLGDKATSRELLVFISDLENDGICDWSVSSPNVHNALCNYYDASEQVLSADKSCPALPQLDVTEIDFFRHVRLILRMRYTEMRSISLSFVISQLLIPFFVVLVLVTSCGDVNYPRVELTSSSIGGIGEVIIGQSSHSAHSSVTPAIHSLRRLQLSEEGMLRDILGDHLSWTNLTSSDGIYDMLFAEYYTHSRNRWGSYMLDDSIDKWIQSNIQITDRSMNMSGDDMFDALSLAQHQLCGVNASANTTTEISPSVESLLKRLIHNASKTDLVYRSIELCDQLSNVEIVYANGTHEMRNVSAFIISSHEPLYANVTLLSNITTDHAVPVFLKELTPSIYDSLITGTWSPVEYQLFSYPFPEANLFNPVYMERGYIGSMMIVLYILICSIAVLRFVTYSRATGLKSRLHVGGLGSSPFWIGNFLFDTVLYALTLCSVFVAICIGGPPIRSFFFDSPPFPGVLFFSVLMLYAASAVSANYAFAALSADQVSSQLASLVMTIVGGLFMKLFLSLHHEVGFKVMSSVLLTISPSYAFSTCVFELFSNYSIRFGRTLGLLAKQSLGLQVIFGAMRCMILQILFYLAITLLIDNYWFSVCYFFSKMWVRTKSMCCNIVCRLEANEESIRDAIGKYMNVISKDDSEEHHPLLQEMRSYNTHSTEKQRSLSEVSVPGRGIVKQLHEHDVGIFPLAHGSASEDINEPDSPQLYPPPLVSTRHLWLEYTSARRYALKDLNMSIRAGERVALLGVSGGGKSTIFKTLSTGELLPTSGSAHIADMDVVMQHNTIMEDNFVGYVPQDEGLLQFMTVEEALNLFSTIRNKSPLPKDSELCRLIPPKYHGYGVSALSGGNRRKLAVVLSNIASPELLLMDEPTSGVDPAAAERIVTYLRHLPEHQSLLFSSHRIEECVTMCDRVIILYEGSVQYDGSMGAFNALTDLFFQVDVEIHSNISPRRYSSFLSQADQECETLSSPMRSFLREFLFFLGGDVSLERITQYSDNLIRLTFEKKIVQFNQVWGILEALKKNDIVYQYSFRKMDMEEVFSILIAASKESI